MYRALLLLLPLLAFPSLTQQTCSSCVDQDGDGYCADGTLPDCDDMDSSIHPDAEEVCGDSIDQNCDGIDQSSDGADHTYYRDADGDGYGVESDIQVACSSPSGYAPARGDCDDADPATHPFATEASSRDGKDQDCGGTDGPSPSVASPAASIQAALDASVNGQTIWVGPGTFGEHDLDFKGKQVTLISTGGQERTVIDAQRLGLGFSFYNEETKSSRLDGFAVRNGYTVGSGGGMYLFYSSPTLTNLTIEGNQASYGGGMCLVSSNPTLTNVTIAGNQADYSGGGMYLDYYSSPTLTGVKIEGNQADHDGGGIFLDGSRPTLTGVTIEGNQADNHGGGMYLDGASPTLTNITIVGNAGWGGGMYLYHPFCNPVLKNVLLAFNAGYNLYSDGGAPSITWSDLYNPSGWDNHNLAGLDATNLTVAPELIEYSPDLDSGNDDPHLRPASPLVNAGDPSLLDPDGSRSDIGAFGGPGAEFGYYADADRDGLYDGWETANGVADAGSDADGDGLTNAGEFAAGTDPRRADSDGDGAADGAELAAGTNPLDWYSRPGAQEVVAHVPGDFATIQAAIDAGWVEARIEVEPGAYQESLVTEGKAVSLWSTAGSTVTTLEGAGKSVVQALGGRLELRGFTVTGGDAWYGGGLALWEAEGVLEDLVVTGNRGGSYGGGIYLYSSSPAMSNVTIAGNQAYNGGGMMLDNSTLTMTHVTIAGNQADGYGGGMLLDDSSPTMTNVTIAGNQAAVGGGMSLDNSSPTLSNVTIAGNQADKYGGGIYLTWFSSPRLANVVAAYNFGYYANNLYQDSSSPGAPIFSDMVLYAPPGEVNYSGITPSATTWTWEPGFLAYGTDGLPTDLHLATTSQAANAGDPGIIDPDGSRSDIGAYGGPGADGYDLDGDGFPDWFWPGTIDQPPSGFSRSSYDADDRDPAVH